MNKIEEEFISRGAVIMKSNDKWFVMSKQTSLEFINACEKEKIQILGIDGFYLHENGGIEPSMANSIDFSSSHKEGANSYDDAIRFIQKREDNLYYEVICEE